jgi:nucleoprotein TPR
LREKLRAVQAELVQMAEQEHSLQSTLDTERTAWANDRRTLEDTIVDLSTSEQHSLSDRTVRETEVRQQEERAKVRF